MVPHPLTLSPSIFTLRPRLTRTGGCGFMITQNDYSDQAFFAGQLFKGDLGPRAHMADYLGGREAA